MASGLCEYELLVAKRREENKARLAEAAKLANQLFMNMAPRPQAARRPVAGRRASAPEGPLRKSTRLEVSKSFLLSPVSPVRHCRIAECCTVDCRRVKQAVGGSNHFAAARHARTALLAPGSPHFPQRPQSPPACRSTNTQACRRGNRAFRRTAAPVGAATSARHTSAPC